MAITLPASLRLSQSAAAIANSQKSANSQLITRIPRSVNNPAPDIGETGIGRQGRKYRVLSKGAKNATPNPPFVIASKNPWDAVIKVKKIVNFKRDFFEDHPRWTDRNAAAIPINAAKNNE